MPSWYSLGCEARELLKASVRFLRTTYKSEPLIRLAKRSPNLGEGDLLAWGLS
jgi:hypothetical protein